MVQETLEPGLREYRVYLFDPNCGIVSRHEFHAEDDAAAILQARALYTTSPMPRRGFEVWQRKRHILTEGC